MTTPFSFATSADAAAYDFSPVPPDGQLARATQAIRDAAGIQITPQATSTAELRACRGELRFPGPLVASITEVQSLASDGTLTEVTGWEFDAQEQLIRLPCSLPWTQRHGRFSVTYVHGLTDVTPGLVLLTLSVAQRLMFTRPDAATLQSKTVGSVSWTARSSGPPADALSEGECERLARLIPLRRIFQVAI